MTTSRLLHTHIFSTYFSALVVLCTPHTFWRPEQVSIHPCMYECHASEILTFPVLYGVAVSQNWCVSCRRITELLELQEGRDYEHVCLGENGFGYMIDNLARANTTLPTHCDIGVSSITASVEREDMGIQFSRTTHRSALAVLVFAPLKQRGIWAFFEPLHVYVWMSLVFTVIVTPFFVFFFESVFSKRCATFSLLFILFSSFLNKQIQKSHSPSERATCSAKKLHCCNN